MTYPPPPYPPPPPPRAGWLAPDARTNGFTAVQLSVLRNQIVAYRSLAAAWADRVGSGAAAAGAPAHPVPPALLAAVAVPDLPARPVPVAGGRVPPPPAAPAGVPLPTDSAGAAAAVAGAGATVVLAGAPGLVQAGATPATGAWAAAVLHHHHAPLTATGPLFHFRSDPRAGRVKAAAAAAAPSASSATTTSTGLPFAPLPDGSGCAGAAALARHWPAAWERARARAEAAADAALTAAKAAGDVEAARTATLRRRLARLARLQARLRAEADREGAGLAGLGAKAYLHAARSADEALRAAARTAANRRLAAAGILDWAPRLKAWKAAAGDAADRASDARALRTRLALKARTRLSRLVGVPLGPGGKPRPRAVDAEADRAARMAALQANDWTKYQALLKASARGGGAAGAGPGGGPALAGVSAGEKFAAIERFLAETDGYLAKLTARLASTKADQAGRDARAAAVAAARAGGATDADADAAGDAAAADASAAAAAAAADVQAAAAAAAEAGGGPGGAGGAMAAYLALASSSSRPVTGPPAGLVPPAGASLRPYQLVGLQWMVSLYDNTLNGILADEMGLGKTVQVMALLAYLLEHRNDAGPHLIIVPNAVLVNWRSELAQWVPGMDCVFYVGRKAERAALYASRVAGGKGFHILVTTFEFIMRDRARLSKVPWRYIVIDEAQRMKDRDSKLARDLRSFSAARRLLLTGTPLQNELRELWALLNLLLPDVFASRAEFAAWFVESLGGGGDAAAGGGDAEDAALAVERRVVVINRLHQILTPFMLRRQVADVEGKLPPKVAVTVRSALAPAQAAAYRWVAATATLRVDPAGVPPGKAVREYAPLNNRAVELRKLANHPYLSYPASGPADGSARTAADLVAACGKFAVLDRILVKLRAAGHRVLLFSTMTRLLDLLEAYLATRPVPPPPAGWPRLPDDGSGARPAWARPGAAHAPMGWLRIDGNTTLEEREERIKAFNAPDSAAFVFLLSIRAAGRGLNLQTADTVIIYDPDPNPKNEEQAIARAHRIGQTKAVRVLHFEAVTGGGTDSDAAIAAAVERGRAVEGGGGGRAAAGRPPPPPPPTGAGGRAGAGYGPSVETLVRGTIQAAKMAMAAEVVDAGRFDTVTSNEARRATLEQLLAASAEGAAVGSAGPDTTGAAAALSPVGRPPSAAAAAAAAADAASAAAPSSSLSIMSHAELNAALARDDDERALFDRLDAEYDWPDAALPSGAVPPWLAYDAPRLAAVREHQANPFAAPGTLGASGAARVDGSAVLPPHLRPSGPRAARPRPGALTEAGADGWIDDEPGGEQAGRRRKRGASSGGRSRSATPTEAARTTARGTARSARGGSAATTRPSSAVTEEEEEEGDEVGGGSTARGRRTAPRRRGRSSTAESEGTEEEHVDDADNVRWD